MLLVRRKVMIKKTTVFGNFPTFHMKILLGDFNAKLGREEILKQTIVSEVLHQVRN
jgi:hypothetical protein